MSSRAPYVISIRHATAGRCSRRPVSSSGAAGQRGGDPPAADGPEVDEILEFVTGRTLEMTGADLVVLALPGEGHRQLTIRHPAGNGYWQGYGQVIAGIEVSGLEEEFLLSDRTENADSSRSEPNPDQKP